MANLKADSPLCRRIVASFLNFLNSVEPSSANDVESLEVAKDCLSEVFKIGPSATSSIPKSESLVHIFTSQTGPNNEIKSDQVNTESRASSTTNAPVVSEDELFVQFFGALEKVHYFGTTSGDDEHVLDRATQLFHNALMEMKKSERAEINLKNLADTFKLQGNKAMQSKVYSDAIELYTIAIALCDDNAVYYCNRAAAYTQNNQHTEAIHDCHKAIAIDPNYSKAYSRLGFSYYAQGNYRDAIEKGFRRALQLDPNNESVRGNIQAAEQKLREEYQRAERGRSSSSWSYSNGGSRSHGPIPPFPGFPTSMAESVDLSSFMADLGSRMQSGDGGPGIRRMNTGDDLPPGVTRINPGDDLPEEIIEGIRSAMQMFHERDGTADNSDGN
ncbi:putative tetratricopeptide-like helical domain superfamily, SGTA, homodimerization [Helianthus anomalus]